MVPVVQLVRASDCGSECRGFESHRAPWKSKTQVLEFQESAFFLWLLFVPIPYLYYKRQLESWFLSIFFIYFADYIACFASYCNAYICRNVHKRCGMRIETAYSVWENYEYWHTFWHSFRLLCRPFRWTTWTYITVWEAARYIPFSRTGTGLCGLERPTDWTVMTVWQWRRITPARWDGAMRCTT